MHWELWDVETGNLVGTRDDESAALALVCELVGKGWPVSALSLMAEDESMPEDALPPAVSGDELAHRAGLSGQVRRSA